MAQTVYRNGALHMAWYADNPSDGFLNTPRIHIARVPLTLSSDQSLQLSASPAAGYRAAWLEQAEPSFLIDTHSTIAVNAAGDELIAFVRGGGNRLMYVKWRSGDAAPSPEVNVWSRPHPPFLEPPLKIDYAWAAVDPADDLSFWFAHRVKQPDGSAGTLVVSVTP
jgi:hypothetical protein